jgi:hypothetical protein
MTNHKKQSNLQSQVDRIIREMQRKRSVPRHSPRPKYTEHIVCFMDLLGFRNRVLSMSTRDAQKEIQRLEKLFELIVEPYRDPYDKNDPLAIQVNYFSDCMCLALPLSASNLKTYIDKIFWFLLHILEVQGELIFHGHILRGGITIDRHYSSSKLIFSRAQIRAYDIEHSQAVYPTVVVDQSVFAGIKSAIHKFAKKPSPLSLELLKSDLQGIGGLLATREDGKSFVNYLGFWTELDNEYDIPRFFRAHKTLIESSAHSTRHSPAITEKYRWMARYHNTYVQKKFPQETDLHIKEEAFGSINIDDFN